MLGRLHVSDEKGVSRLPKDSPDNQWQVFLSLTLHSKYSESESNKNEMSHNLPYCHLTWIMGYVLIAFGGDNSI